MKETFRKIVKVEVFLAELLFKTDLGLGVLYWIVVGAQYAAPLVSVWMWKLILDEFTEIYHMGNYSICIWVYLGIYLLLNMLASLLKQIGSILSEQINRKATHNLDMQIMRKLSKIDMSFFDNPENRDKLIAAQTSETHITGSMAWIFETTIRIISFFVGVVMFLSYNPIFGVIYLATFVPGAIISYKHKAKADQWSLDSIPETRKKDYYKSLLIEHQTAKELRLYNIAEYFKEKYNCLWNKIRAERESLFIKGTVDAFLASLLTYIGIVSILLLSVGSVLNGTMAIGTLALYIGLAETSGENFRRIVEDIACQVEIDIPRAYSFIEFMHYENNRKVEGTDGLPEDLDVEFRNVYFRYPGSEQYVINNLNLKIEHGKKIALVGVNGAGKTTLIRLLLGFYEPEMGEILLGGKNINTYCPAELNHVFSVCFQEVQPYAMSIRENIAISDIDRQADDAAILHAAEASGAEMIINNSPEGLDSQMTRLFDNEGIELSYGQWQKIAIARAFFRNSNFLILDEPSAALDAQAEDNLFASFQHLCKNKGGILISHRLSSVMMVDEICVMDKGAIVEVGTHEDLIRKNGKYAEMYRLQAGKYVRSAKNA